MQLRKRLVDEYPTVCLGNSEISNVAIRELYEEVMLGLLPKRFPTIFQIKGDVFQNLVTGTQHSISAALVDHSNMLRQLATNVEEDFWLMVPNEQNEFILQGFVACFPQGLLPAAKVGMSVSEIHKPIPGYEGRLKKGVVRCFERMARGQSIARLNVHMSYPTPFLMEIGNLTRTHSGLFNATKTLSISPMKAPTRSKPPTAPPKTTPSTLPPLSSVSNTIH